MGAPSSCSVLRARAGRVSRAAPGAEALARATRCGAIRRQAAGAGRPSIMSTRVASARRPSSPKSWRTVVSGGRKYADSGMSSNPTTLMSPGTRRPCSASARSSPSAMWSFPQNTAVISGLAAIRCPSR